MTLRAFVQPRSVACGVVTLAFCWGLSSAGAQTGPLPVRALYLKNIPSAYEAQTPFFAAAKQSGADTLIVDLPLNAAGRLDVVALPQIVFRAHAAGLKVLTVVPTRDNNRALMLHPSWEDARVDLERGSLQGSGRLDLFNPEVIEHLTGLFGESASYAVDGILFGADFSYGPLEGLSEIAQKTAEQALGEKIKIRSLFPSIGKGTEGTVLDQTGPGFPAWTALKRDRLLAVLDALRASLASAKHPVTLGLTVPLVLPVTTSAEILKRYAYDMDALRQRNIDHFWTVIDHRALMTVKGMTYRSSLEMLSRAVVSAVTAVREEWKVLIVLSAVSEGGRPLPLTEIEEVTGLVTARGKVGIGYVVTPNAVLSPVFTHKVFRRDGERSKE